MSEDTNPDKVSQAKARLERAFRVKYDREPLSEQEEILIQLAAERAAKGEQAIWTGTTESPSIEFHQEQDLDEETRWKFAREAVCKLGFSQREASDKYGLSYEALRKKCQREEWPIPQNVAKEATRLSQIVSQNRLETRVTAETWLERGEKSRNLAWAITEKPLDQLLSGEKPIPKVESWSDVAQIVKLNRQAAGLDTSEAQVSATFNFAMLGQEVPSADIVEVEPEKQDLPE
jgi:hypothetical protein